MKNLLSKHSVLIIFFSITFLLGSILQNIDIIIKSSAEYDFLSPFIVALVGTVVLFYVKNRSNK